MMPATTVNSKILTLLKPLSNSQASNCKLPHDESFVLVVTLMTEYCLKMVINTPIDADKTRQAVAQELKVACRPNWEMRLLPNVSTSVVQNFYHCCRMSH